MSERDQIHYNEAVRRDEVLDRFIDKHPTMHIDDALTILKERKYNQEERLKHGDPTLSERSWRKYE